VLDAIAAGVFSPGEPDRYRGLVNALFESDSFMVTADFASYCVTREDVGALWRDQVAWWRASALNTANVGWFSADRAIRTYAAEIWDTPVAEEG
jgi:glycogen phosphorylase